MNDRTNFDDKLSQIQGFSQEQISYAFDELTKGTDDITLEIFLFRKFGLFDTKAQFLIKELRRLYDIQPVIHPTIEINNENVIADIEFYELTEEDKKAFSNNRNKGLTENILGTIIIILCVGFVTSGIGLILIIPLVIFLNSNIEDKKNQDLSEGNKIIIDCVVQSNRWLNNKGLIKFHSSEIGYYKAEHWDLSIYERLKTEKIFQIEITPRSKIIVNSSLGRNLNFSVNNPD
jgi:hypothetical protein